MRIAVTGSNGYVGGVILRYLQQTGSEIIELRRVRDREQPADNVVPFSLGETPVDARLRSCDVLVHCAYDLSAIRWNDVEERNIEGSRRLFSAAENLGIKRLILISSISAFDESASQYGRAKIAIEKLAQGFNGVIVRPGLVYGESPGGMMGTLRRFVTRLPVVPVIGGAQEMFLVHQDDLAEMIRRLTHESHVPAAPLFACNERQVQFRRVLQLLATSGGKSPVFIPVPWRGAWLGLKILEMFGVRVGIKSDSLVSMMNPNPAPDFDATRGLGFEFRQFAPAGT